MKTKFPENFLNKIVCGSAVDVMKQIPDGSVHLVITSPPYNHKRRVRGGLLQDRRDIVSGFPVRQIII